ncbi:hypothetical protein [Pedobacter sp. SL55]|uniref:hypothetical protein n=1 Tax=Pedobacter sp. SL55 TaxID=2995161 RepID=UPI00226F3037|nr:hypothetical protein [Pedobacter sp. SL55]WAC42569.1 hypothetical protein OVA16_09505 [Pedobacter sp. SL55]
MKKIYLTLTLILSIFTTHAQNFDVRKLTLKSDVILLYDQDSIAYIDEVINDHTTNHFYQLKAVTQTIKNSASFKFTNAKLPYLLENEDYFKIYQKEDCMGVGKVFDGVKRKFYGMLFLQKKGKNYEAIGTVQNDDPLSVWQELIKQIQSVSTLEKIKDPKERYTKSIDWFLDNNTLPDENFIKYYKQKGILKTDTAQLTEQQLARAKGLFFNGNETFLDLIASTNQTEIRDYYLQKLKDIVFQSEYEFGDCVRFRRIVCMLTKDFNENYDDLNRVLSDLLTKDELESYEKRPIMNHLIDLIEKKTYQIGTFSASKL